MKQKEKGFLGFLTLLGLVMIPIWFNKGPRKDWTIVFLLAGFLSGMMDLFATAHKLIRYPSQIFGKKMNISILFADYLIRFVFQFYNVNTLMKEGPE
ncbi:hypothetical protein GCM10009001_35930 [Virgibacillus siamensis]|uniref:Uncharacterized protein n=1 Tax=Virgibacillus siamensis TaxID=480071 RepID=A0ABN1GNX0_9BACI